MNQTVISKSVYLVLGALTASTIFYYPIAWLFCLSDIMVLGESVLKKFLVVLVLILFNSGLFIFKVHPPATKAYYYFIYAFVGVVATFALGAAWHLAYK